MLPRTWKGGMCWRRGRGSKGTWLCRRGRWDAATAKLSLQHIRLKDDFVTFVDGRLLKGGERDLRLRGHCLIDVNPGGFGGRPSSFDSSFVQRAVFQKVRCGPSTSQ